MKTQRCQHYSRAELLALAADSTEIPSSERRRLLLHLGGDCEICSARLRPEGTGGADSRPAPCFATHDPLLRALRRRLPGPRNVPEAERLWPRHLYLAENGEAPLAFLRLLIEEAADLEAPNLQHDIAAMLERARRDLELLAETIATEPELPLSPRASEARQWSLYLADLEALVDAYLARERRNLGGAEKAMEKYHRAWQTLARGTAADLVEKIRDPGYSLNALAFDGTGPAVVGAESLATLLDLESRWALEDGNPDQAQALFFCQIAVLDSSRIPERRTEGRLGLVRALLLQGMAPMAKALLQRPKAMPGTACNPRLRLEIDHLEVLAKMATGEYREVIEQLAEQEAFCERMRTPAVQLRHFYTQSWAKLQLQEPMPEEFPQFLFAMLTEWRSKEAAEVSQVAIALSFEDTIDSESKPELTLVH